MTARAQKFRGSLAFPLQWAGVAGRAVQDPRGVPQPPSTAARTPGAGAALEF